ncbi:MAG TPA: VCBS repeat-containing protein, partial [Solirubrobacteraceae bacterium]
RSSDGQILVGTSQAQDFTVTKVWATLGGGQTVRAADVDGDGIQDLVSTDSTGQMKVASSTTESFGTARAVGNWPAAGAMVLGDVDGDGRADAYGRYTLSGGVSLPSDVNVALSTIGLYPEAIDALATPEADPPDEQYGSYGAPAVRTHANGTDGQKIRLHLAFQEDQGFVTRESLKTPGDHFSGTAPTDPGPVADQKLRDMYLVMRNAGFTHIRMMAKWGELENADGSMYWTKLDRAVNLALDMGIQPYFTVTGYADGGQECDGVRHMQNTSCRTLVKGPTGINPQPAEYASFFGKLAKHFTTNDGPCHKAGTPQENCLRVQVYGVWNEPNLGARENPGGGYRDPTFLSANSATPRMCQYDKYMQLYDAAAAEVAKPDVAPRARLMIGELAGAPNICFQGTTRQFLTPMAWLRKALRNKTTPVRVHGFALHPYQHQFAPWHATKPAATAGIGFLNRNKDSEAEAGRVCDGPASRMLRGIKQQLTCLSAAPENKLRSMYGPGERPAALYLTEFGYFNRPRNDDPETPRTQYHTEIERAKWSTGYRTPSGTERRGVLDRAKGNARMLVHYDLFETAGPYGHDSGVMNEDGVYGAVGSANRPYGKPFGPPWRDGAGDLRQDQAQARRMMCAYWRWAKSRNYPTRRIGCSTSYSYRLP